MKKTTYITILIILFVFNYTKVNAQQDHVLVDSKVKIYHKDGTRSYKDYQPFKTRTVALLSDFNPSNKSPKLSKYGGSLEHQTNDATGFFHVKKIGDRWWGIDPLGYRYFNIALNSINTPNPSIKKLPQP